MAIALNPTQNDDALRAREADLKAALFRAQAIPNPDATTLANIAAFNRELSDIGSKLGESKANDLVALFNQYAPDYNTTQDEQAIKDLFGQVQEQKLRDMTDQFGTQRKQAIEEAAVTGNLRNPGFLTKDLGAIDALKARAAQELMASLGLGQTQAILDARNQNRSYGFNKAGAIAGLKQGGQQFADTLGFNREKFGADYTLNKRQQDLDELFRRDSLSESIRTRDDKKPGLMDKISKGVQLGRDINTGFGEFTSGPFGQMLKPGGSGGSSGGGGGSPTDVLKLAALFG